MFKFVDVSKLVQLVVFSLMGCWNVSFAQVKDTFLLEGKTYSIKIDHTILSGDSIFPTFEVNVKPLSLLGMNSSTIAFELGGRYRWNKTMHASASYKSGYSEEFALRSVKSLYTPMHDITAEIGYKVYGRDLEMQRRKVKVFVDKGRGKEKVIIVNRQHKRYNVVPTIGLSWKRFQPINYVKRLSDNTVFVSSDARITNLNFGIHLDVSKGYRTQANSKKYTRIRRGSLDVGISYAVHADFQWYKRSLYDSPYTYSEVSPNDLPNFETLRLGWYWRYNYMIGLKNNGGLILGASLGRLSRQTYESSGNFEFLEDVSARGYLVGLSMGYTFSSSVF